MALNFHSMWTSGYLKLLEKAYYRDDVKPSEDVMAVC